MEIGISSKVPTMPSVVQLVIKSVNPLKGGIGLKIIPLLIQTFAIPTPMTTIVSQPMEGSERFDKKKMNLVVSQLMEGSERFDKK
jgi:hypothetical protein